MERIIVALFLLIFVLATAIPPLFQVGSKAQEVHVEFHKNDDRLLNETDIERF